MLKLRPRRQLIERLTSNKLSTLPKVYTPLNELENSREFEKSGDYILDSKPKVFISDFQELSCTLVHTFRGFIKNRHDNNKVPLSHRTNVNELLVDDSEALYIRQLQIEEDQKNESIVNLEKLIDSLTKMGLASSRMNVQLGLLELYEPFVNSIRNYIEGLGSKKLQKVSGDNTAPFLLMLPVEKIAIITLDATINLCLRCGNAGIGLTELTTTIAGTFETEVHLRRIKAKKGQVQPWQKKIVADCLKTAKVQNVINKKLCKISDLEEWSSPTKVQLGAFLVDMLIRSTIRKDGEPSFIHTLVTPANRAKYITQGVIKINPQLYQEFVQDVKNLAVLFPRFYPMVVPPKKWDNKNFYGAYFRLKAPLMRTMSKLQVQAVRRAEMDSVLEGLDYLGSLSWKINEPVLNVVQMIWDKNLALGEIPQRTDLPVPEKDTCYRSPEDIKKTLWGIRLREFQESIEKSEEPTAPVFDEQLYKTMCQRVEQKNAELHSLRCDLLIKLDIANKFRDDKIYFPYNLDFRGRAYTVPPNLCHVGSDMCRGLLYFAEPKPLGERGLFWLKVHLANLFGYNKVSFSDRVAWVDENIHHVIESATHPLGKKEDKAGWWSQAESPFQALAACIEIDAASKYPSGHSNYPCRLPVHQDGSCNGLQHYAGLGRDELGGVAVNLVDSQCPQDVYSRVLDIVNAQLEIDAKIPEDAPDKTQQETGKYARYLKGKVKRKVIKQTVMTSVYGVTALGAREQIHNRLAEMLHENPNLVLTPEMESELFFASNYLAKLTLKSLGEMFNSAKHIMDWLGACSRLVSLQGHVMSWVTPLGLPVIQPYRKTEVHKVTTVLQSITLTVNHDYLPVAGSKQKSAFPPNYVHSLDATHMLMTCLRMKDLNLAFASVHDSFWTHACDVDQLNEAVRDCFVELYEYPVLEDLRDSLVMRFPDVDFPPIPTRGSLDVTKVKESSYFFH